MKLFYHHLWVEKKPPVEPLREAQLAIRRHPEQIPELVRACGSDFTKTLELVARRPAAAADSPAKAGGHPAVGGPHVVGTGALRCYRPEFRLRKLGHVDVGPTHRSTTSASTWRSHRSHLVLSPRLGGSSKGRPRSAHAAFVTAMVARHAGPQRADKETAACDQPGHETE